MLMLLITIATSLFAIFSFYITFRGLISRQWVIWILPFVLSVGLLYLALMPLRVVATGMIEYGSSIALTFLVSPNHFLILAFFVAWYFMLLTFKNALTLLDFKRVEEKTNLESERYAQLAAVKNYEKLAAKFKKREKEIAGRLYPYRWVKLFD